MIQLSDEQALRVIKTLRLALREIDNPALSNRLQDVIIEVANAMTRADQARLERPLEA